MGTYGFGMFNIFFTITFVLVIVCFITVFVLLVKSLIGSHSNRKAPRLTIPATVVTKRVSVSHYSGTNAGNVTQFHSSSSTRYFVTFEVESGDRIELSASGEEYGMLAEGDIGMLTFKGTDLISFDRQ